MAGVSQSEAIQTLDEGQAALHALVARLSDDQLIRPATIGGTGWSAKDLLGHLAFWEELAIDAVDSWRAGRRLAVEDIPDVPGGTDAANARNQERTAAQSLVDVRSRARAAHHGAIERIRGLSPEEWQSRPLAPEEGPDETLGELLGGVLGMDGRPFGHAFAHLRDLAAYVEACL